MTDTIQKKQFAQLERKQSRGQTLTAAQRSRLNKYRLERGEAIAGIIQFIFFVAVCAFIIYFLMVSRSPPTRPTYEKDKDKKSLSSFPTPTPFIF